MAPTFTRKFLPRHLAASPWPVIEVSWAARHHSHPFYMFMGGRRSRPLASQTGTLCMKGDASLFAAVDLGSNAFRMMIGQ